MIANCQSAIRNLKRRRGQVAKARVCKTLIMGSNPIDASLLKNRKNQGEQCFVPFTLIFSFSPWIFRDGSFLASL
jgi:hypothetical protein